VAGQSNEGQKRVMEIDFKPYRELLEEYGNLKTENISGAFQLMKKSASLSGFYGENLANVTKLVADTEFQYKHIKAKKSKELAPGKPTEGERLAMADEEVAIEHGHFSDAVFLEKTLSNMVDTIDKIYFDSKNVWDKGNYNFRTKRDDV
jgi:hypothetical protein